MPSWIWFVLLLCLLFGFGGPALHIGYYGWSPLGILLVAILVWYLFFRGPRTPVV